MPDEPKPMTSEEIKSGMRGDRFASIAEWRATLAAKDLEVERCVAEIESRERGLVYWRERYGLSHRQLIETQDDNAALRKRIAELEAVADVPHLIEVAEKRATERACEGGLEDSGEVCQEACESIEGYCDMCLICAFLGTMADIRCRVSDPATFWCSSCGQEIKFKCLDCAALAEAVALLRQIDDDPAQAGSALVDAFWKAKRDARDLLNRIEVQG